MFFSASARLASQTAELGDLAEHFDEFLAAANESWLIETRTVAEILGEREDRVAYLLEQAARPEVGLLVEESYIRCGNCENLIPLSDLEEADENEEELRCSSCHIEVTNATETRAYRLGEEARAEARRRLERPRRKIAILTALELERKAVLDHLSAVKRENHPRGTVYQVGIFETEDVVWEVATTSIGAGNPGAAAEAERVIEHFEPEAALFVGIAGGIKDVELGDVVASEDVFLYHSGKATETFRANPQSYRPTNDLVSGARATAVENAWQSRIAAPAGPPPKAIVAPIVAGEQVVASTESPTYAQIREHYGRAVAVDMEAGGFLRGTYGNRQVASLVIRGISDLLADKAEADAAGSQPRAAAHAAAFAFELIAKLP